MSPEPRSPAAIWDKLDHAQRERLLHSRFDFPLPREVLTELTQAGALMIGTSWEGGQFEFFLTAEWIEFLEERALDEDAAPPS